MVGRCLSPLPQLQYHMGWVWILHTCPWRTRTHTHTIIPELYGTGTLYRRMLPWEHGYRICSWFSSFLYRYFQNSVSLVISFLVSLFPWLHNESLWVLFSRSFSTELGGWMSIPILDSKSIVLIISFIYLQLNLRICLHKTPPCPRIYDHILLSTPSAQVLLLSRAGVAPSLSAQTFLCHLYSRPRCYFESLCLCSYWFSCEVLIQFLIKLLKLSRTISLFTIKSFHWLLELPFATLSILYMFYQILTPIKRDTIVPTVQMKKLRLTENK